MRTRRVSVFVVPVTQMLLCPMTSDPTEPRKLALEKVGELWNIEGGWCAVEHHEGLLMLSMLET